MEHPLWEKRALDANELRTQFHKANGINVMLFAVNAA